MTGGNNCKIFRLKDKQREEVNRYIADHLGTYNIYRYIADHSGTYNIYRYIADHSGTYNIYRCIADHSGTITRKTVCLYGVASM